MVEKKHTNERKEAGLLEEPEEDDLVPLVFHIHNILHSIFFKVALYINSQQKYNSKG